MPQPREPREDGFRSTLPRQIDIQAVEMRVFQLRAKPGKY